MFKFPRRYRIALTAPAGSCDENTILAGKAVLEKYGNEVILMPHISDRDSLGYLSAGDDKRAADINAAVNDENIDLIWAVRGGYGCMRILDKIDWEMLKKRDIPILGFSDITALHWAMAKHGINSYFAAPMMKFIAGVCDSLTAETLHAAFSGEDITLKLDALRPGKICAYPLPGNLTVAAALCGTEFFPDTTGKILILEEVGEAPYRIDRMLTQLRLAGAFEKCAGIVFGSFTGCGETPEVMAVLQNFTGNVTCPVFCNLPHGHELPFYSISGRQLISITPR
ncbi:MAG: LD-carboxypeptidase [Lentisphaerae bacterium]|nr:LD-carboxypeptidase [Lentisphaerota bacterium]